MMDTLNEAGATIKFGTVSASKPGFARVRLPEADNMRTMWLPILYPKTQNDQACWTYDNGEQVAVLLDARGEDGVILGAIYSDADRPPTASPDKFIVKFKDGAVFEYDCAMHTATLQGVQNVFIQAGTKVTIDAVDTEITGNLTVGKVLAANGGLTAKAGAGGGAAMTIAGDTRVNGSLTASGTITEHS
ncbi:phage baseplate assembly protein V [Comamonas terrigena]|uniref:phage baseplate assembly protein V n=2 Tax=Comamonas terrigena TaxID=32013 RepID=UPI00244AB686|nr:phage baseplate assembly protein V [Comamonas terrigena]MDH0512655.1 phage baseplate assembly protein V [Comamonas terrigena]